MGLDIGMQNSGIEPLLACEINKEARATIVNNNKHIGLIGDIWGMQQRKRFINSLIYLKIVK